MKVQFVVNNYVLGAKVKTTPIDKIIANERIDSKHTKIVYDNISERELAFIRKCLPYKGLILE